MTSESFSSRAELVTKPGPHDVLCGRGGGFNNHCGNVKFRQLVNEHKHRYMSVGKLEKPNVAREVVQSWRAQDPPGRFLAHTDNFRKGPGSVKAKGSIWFDVGDKKAAEKASSCLRRPIDDVFPSLRKMQRQQDVLTAFGLHALECQTSLGETTRAEDTLKKAGDALATPGGNVTSAMQQNSQFASSHQDNVNSRLNHPYPLQWGEQPTPSRPGYLANSVISSGLQSQDMSLMLQQQNQALPLETASHQQDQGLASTSPMSTTHKNMMLQLLLAQQAWESSILTAAKNVLLDRERDAEAARLLDRIWSSRVECQARDLRQPHHACAPLLGERASLNQYVSDSLNAIATHERCPPFFARQQQTTTTQPMATNHVNASCFNTSIQDQNCVRIIPDAYPPGDRMSQNQYVSEETTPKAGGVTNQKRYALLPEAKSFPRQTRPKIGYFP